MKESNFKKIVFIWVGVILIFFALGITYFFKNSENSIQNKSFLIGIIFISISIILTIPYRWFLLSYSHKWDFWSLKCPKCGFNWEPVTGSTEYISTSQYDFFHPGFWSKKIRLPFFIRCPQCHKFSWCKYIVERRELNKERVISFQTILAFLIIFILIIFALWNLFKIFNMVNLLS